MKNILFISLILLCCTCSLKAHEEPPKTKKEKADAKAKQEKMIRNGINQVTIWRHNIENGIVSDANEKYAELYYNEKGLNTSILVYSNDSISYKTINVFDLRCNKIFDFDFEYGNPSGNAVFQYNSSGLIEKIYNFDSLQKVVSEDTYTYKTSQNQIVFSSISAPEKTDYTYTYSYDGNIETGNCTEIEHRDSTGKLVMRVENVFDKNNIRQEKKIFNSDNELDYKFSYTYTSSGDFSVITKTSSDGKIMETDTYSYDDKGNLISVVSKDGDGIVTDALSYEYSFDFATKKTETPNSK
ncbi:hypothetical protein SDC9_64165 [bioreactor metagenome]|uniref:YD repeat-containing protein n=1 Tax=bioreactor metagenome TaxID=1076179 RepID=A0A644XNK3_9ZZZZ